MTARDDSWALAILSMVEDGDVRTSNIADERRTQTVRRTLAAMEQLGWLTRESKNHSFRHPTSKAAEYISVNRDDILDKSPPESSYKITARDRIWDTVLPLLATKGKLRVGHIDAPGDRNTKRRTLKSMEHLGFVTRRSRNNRFWIVGDKGAAHLTIDDEILNDIWLAEEM